jgi:LPPG:FO 2-phospho-L-lactate transferase
LRTDKRIVLLAKEHLITALAGGVGAARFLTGLVKLVKEEDLTIIVNTGDDIKLHGLHVSPDIDTVTYTLAGIVDDERGWGIRGDTFHCLETLEKFGQEVWFALGDKDLATHVFRTALLKKGEKLSKSTSAVSCALGVKANIVPMTDDHFETRIITKNGTMHFQEYLVKRAAKDEVLGVEFVGADVAKPAAGVVEAVMNAEMVVVCPSNPVVSIGTILAVNGVRDALRSTNARKVAISPIIAGAPVKGPADKLLTGLGLEVSAYSVAKLYLDFLGTYVVDVADSGEKGKIEKLGINVKVTNTVMRTLEDKVNLAKVVLEA